MRTLAEQIAHWGGVATALEEQAKVDLLWKTVFALLADTARFAFPDRSGAKRPIVAHLVPHPGRNAMATVCRTQTGELIDVIGLQAGLPTALASVFADLMRRDEVLPMLKGPDHAAPPGAPSDESYEMLSGVCAMMGVALVFVLQHEISHLINGHVDFLNQKHGLAALSESDSFSEADANLTRYALEFDADCSAAGRTARYGLVSIEEVQHKGAGLMIGIRRVFQSEETFAHCLGFALLVFFTVMPGKLTSALGGRQHAATHVRFTWVMSTLATLEIVGKLSVAFGEAAMAGCMSAARALALRSGNREPFDFIEVGIDQGRRELLSEIRAEWERIRPVLLQFKRGGNLAPADPNEMLPPHLRPVPDETGGRAGDDAAGKIVQG